MTIKHIVISGAAYNGINQVGTIYKLEENGIINKDDIESIYATSAGVIAMVIWMLGIEKSVLYDYIINRPWHKMYQLKLEDCFSILQERGLLDKNIFINIMSPILRSKNIDLNITLKEFHDIIHTDFNIYVTDTNTIKYKCLNHETYPNLKLLDAIYMTSSLPGIFKPMKLDGSFVIDGGICCFFPVKNCINDGCKMEEILGIKVTRMKDKMNDDINILEYFTTLVNNIVVRLSSPQECELTNIINIQLNMLGAELNDILNNSEKRKNMLCNGETAAEKFIHTYLQSSIKELVK